MCTLSLSIQALNDCVKGRMQNNFSDLMKKLMHCSLVSLYDVQVSILGTIWPIGHSHGLFFARYL